MYILRFLGYYIVFGLFVILPFKYLLLLTFGATKENSYVVTAISAFFIFSYVIHVLFSHKCAVVKSSPGVSAWQAVKISFNEYIGYIKLLLSRN